MNFHLIKYVMYKAYSANFLMPEPESHISYREPAYYNVKATPRQQRVLLILSSCMLVMALQERCKYRSAFNRISPMRLKATLCIGRLLTKRKAEARLLSRAIPSTPHNRYRPFSHEKFSAHN